MKKRRSPLSETPLRVPGQSLEDRIEKVSFDEYTKYIAYGVSSIAIFTFGWMIWLSKTLPNPLILSFFGVIGVIYSIRGILITNKKLRLLRLGRDGERAVAEALDKIRSKGAIILHDIVAGEFNIDHIVLARRGIYAIETKTYTKYPGAEISYDGKKIFIGKWEPPKDPVRQAYLNAKWLMKTLKKMTNRNFPVKPIVVFPGWYVRNQFGADKPEVWVLNPEQLLPIISKQPFTLEDEDVKSALYFLTQYIRVHGELI